MHSIGIGTGIAESVGLPANIMIHENPLLPEAEPASYTRSNK